ncbi:hypothetical protein FQN54_001689 [Arachnomyces sp. PD_36]|nr:hypothetical protein FQN54_001689 [Arachnomyces sp. PD_36]
MAATTTTTSSSTSNLENLTTAAFQSATNLLSKLQSQFNRIIPPERQATIQTQLSSFASRRPFVASLLLSQLAFSGVPVLLFALLAIGVLLFSLVTALVVGVLVAILFTALCVGFGLLVLLPVLMITTFLGVAVCGWGWVGWFLLKWFGMIDGDGGGDGRGDGGLGKKQDGGKYKIEGENGLK